MPSQLENEKNLLIQKKITFFVFFLDIFLIVLYDRIVKKRMI